MLLVSIETVSFRDFSLSRLSVVSFHCPQHMQAGRDSGAYFELRGLQASARGANL